MAEKTAPSKPKLITPAELAKRLGASVEELLATPGLPELGENGKFRMEDVAFLLDDQPAEPVSAVAEANPEASPAVPEPEVVKVQMTFPRHTVTFPLAEESLCRDRQFPKPPKAILLKLTESQRVALWRFTAAMQLSGEKVESREEQRRQLTSKGEPTRVPVLNHYDALYWFLDRIEELCLPAAPDESK
jgi:hypothetical protein